jgi:hypothetical protein
MRIPSATAAKIVAWAGVPVTLLASAGLVWQASTAAFSASTATPSNSWTAGTVALVDDDANAAMFTATGLRPNDTGTKCIAVTYNGSLTSAVKLYAASTGTLAPYLNLTVEEGTGGSFGSCAGFSATSTLYNGTVSGFAAANTSYASGVSSWTPTGSGQSRSYRFVYTVQDNNAAQGLTANATFTWEAQNT